MTCHYITTKQGERYLVECETHDEPVAICCDERTAKIAAKDFNAEQADCKRDFL